MWLTIRPIHPSEIPQAIAVHDHQWKAGRPEVITEEDIRRHIRANPEFQIGAFWVTPNGPSGKKEQLMAVVHGVRYQGGKWEKTAHYDRIREETSGNGDTATCITISTAPRNAGVTRDMSVPHLRARGLERIAEGLIREAKYTAAWHGLKFVRAASTPSGINQALSIPKGETATRNQAKTYLKRKNDPAVHITHEALGAKEGGITVAGRPNSGNLTGGGLLVWMDYDLQSVTPAELAAWRLHKEIEPEFVRRLLAQARKGPVPAKPLLRLQEKGEGHEVSLILPTDEAVRVERKISDKIKEIQAHLGNLFIGKQVSPEIRIQALKGNEDLTRIRVNFV